MAFNYCKLVTVILLLSVTKPEVALGFLHQHHRARSDYPINKTDILDMECQIPAVLQPGNVTKFYYLSYRDGSPLTILVTPCSGPISWTVKSFEPPEETRRQGDESRSPTTWPVNELIPGSSPLFSYDGDEAQNFTIPSVRAGLYGLEIKTPLDSNKKERIPKTVLLYATSSALDHLPISYENSRGKRHRALRFQPRRNRRRLTVSWSKSLVDPHLTTYCLAVTSGSSTHPPTLCAAKNFLKAHSHLGKPGSSKEHIKSPPEGLHCVHHTRITLHGLVYDTTYNFTLYVVTRNNVSTRVATESLKYKKTPAQLLHTGRYSSANLKQNHGLINFRYRPEHNGSTEFLVIACGGGVVSAKLKGPDINRKKVIKGQDFLKAPSLESGKKYTLRISATPQELSTVTSVKVLATQAGTINYPEVPSHSEPHVYPTLRKCNEITVGVESAGAAEYCILVRELRGTNQLSSITSIPDQCGLHRRRRSEYTFHDCRNRPNTLRNKAQTFTVTQLQPGKIYQIEITAQIHGHVVAYPYARVETKKNCSL